MATDMNWKVGDWAVFDMRIVQIREIREYGMSVSDGMFETSGSLASRLRPLTLKNKRIMENFNYYYNELRKINGEGGFNYPRISSHFNNLSIQAIDKEEECEAYLKLAQDFVRCARDYQPIIQNIELFRPK